MRNSVLLFNLLLHKQLKGVNPLVFQLHHQSTVVSLINSLKGYLETNSVKTHILLIHVPLTITKQKMFQKAIVLSRRIFMVLKWSSHRMNQSSKKKNSVNSSLDQIHTLILLMKKHKNLQNQSNLSILLVNNKEMRDHLHLILKLKFIRTLEQSRNGHQQLESCQSIKLLKAKLKRNLKSLRVVLLFMIQTLH